MKNGKCDGFSLLRLLGILLILFILAAILFPIFAKAREGRSRSCASNLKQISLGFMQYLQDYDDTFPLAAQPITNENGVLSGWAVTHDTMGNTSLAMTNETPEGEGVEKPKAFAPSPLFPYVKNKYVFRCINAPRKSGPLWFMMNDFVSAAPLEKVSSAARTVLFCDGEDFLGNTGHAYDPKGISAPASFAPTGDVVLGATLQTAPTRHSGGAFYAFADGHVKWMKPSAVFFPSRFSSSPSHSDGKSGRVLGPNPASDKEMHAKGVAATFHLR